MARADGYIRIDTKVNTAGAKAGLGALMGTLTKFAAAAGLAFGVKAVADFAKECTQLASDLAEVQNVVDVTFGSSAEKINAFATTAAVTYGLSQKAAKQYAGTLGAMFKSMGFAEAKAADMSITMAGLAGDMASFYNLSTDEAFQKIRAGISGETEPLAQLGIKLSEANLSAYALKQGLTGTYSALSEQNKALLRYNYLLEVTADAQGDFQRTSTGWANQIRILGLQFDTLKTTLGGAFIAVLSPVLQWINRLLGALNAAAVVFANFVTALTGTQKTATTATEATTAAVEDLTAGTEESGKAAAEAGKKAAKGAQGFDELNIMADPNAAAGAGGGPSIDATTTTPAAAATADPMVDAMAEKIKALAGTYQAEIDRIAAGWETLKGIVLGIFDSIAAQVGETDIVGAAIETALDWVYAFEAALILLTDVIGTVIVAFNIPATVESALGLVSAAFEAIGDVITAITPGVTSFVETAIAPIVEWIGGKVRDALDFFAEQLTILGDWFTANEATFTSLFEDLGAAVNAVWEVISPILDAVWAVLKDVFEQIVAGAMEIGEALSPIIEKAAAFVEAFMAWLEASGVMDFVIAAVQLAGEVIGTVIDTVVGIIEGLLTTVGGIIDFLTGVFTGDWDLAWQGIQDIFSGIIDAIVALAEGLVTILEQIWDAIDETVTSVWNGICQFFTDTWNNITKGVTNAWNGILNFFKQILAFIFAVIKKNWDDTVAFFTGIWTTISTAISTAWNAIAKYFSDTWNTISSTITTAWNAIAKYFSDTWNTISSTITTAWNAVSAFFSGIWEGISTAASDAWAGIKGVWESVSSWFTDNVVTPLSTAFTTLKDGVTDAWDGMWTNIKGTVNTILGGIETFINGSIEGVNTLIDGLNKVITTAGKIIGISITIPTLSDVSLPRLAKGAVIPPNRQFAAILGDQKRGVNIETPLDTMLQAFRAAFAEAGTGGNTEVLIKFTGEMAALAAVLAPEVTVAQNRNNRAAGKTLQVI